MPKHSYSLDQIHLLDPKSIQIDRDNRQRKIFTTDDLKASMKVRGQFTPIIVEAKGEGIWLVAGERRLTTFLENPELGNIKAIFLSDLSEADAQIIELEENFRRQDLAWTETCDAVLKIHLIYSDGDKSWTYQQTANSLGLDYNEVYRRCEVAKEIRAGNSKLEAASGYTTAFSILEAQRDKQREHATALLDADISASFKGPESETYQVEDVKVITSAQGNSGTSPGVEAGGTEAGSERPNGISGGAGAGGSSGNQVPLILGDAIEFFNSYSGVPFNFGHFDFPYGIEYDQMDQANTDKFGAYDDDPDVYWALCEALVRNLPRLFSPSSHFMFWHSYQLRDQTVAFFEKNLPEGAWVHQLPLVWLKSDGKGIVADYQRRPRNVTEFALMITFGDRKINKAVHNAYAAPTSKVIHGSEKPVPVLKHFFQMFVDSTTRMLDPTAGSANSLIAALDFHPHSVLGIEKDPGFHSLATQALKKEMTLRALSQENSNAR